VKRAAFHVQRKAFIAHAKRMNHSLPTVVFADLVGNGARGFTRRLAGRLAFAARDRFAAFV
jgi:hypothetical protein